MEKEEKLIPDRLIPQLRLTAVEEMYGQKIGKMLVARDTEGIRKTEEFFTAWIGELESSFREDRRNRATSSLVTFFDEQSDLITKRKSGSGKRTGLKDKHGNEICVGQKTRLVLDSGEERIFDVAEKTVVRSVVNHPAFENGVSKVAITGVVFEWNGFDLFPCVDENGVPDNEKMEIVSPQRRED